MPTVVDLGQKVKTKYPGQYDDLDDASVGRKVKEKFPTAYADFSDAVPYAQQTPAQQVRSQARAKFSLTGREAPTPSIPAQLADLAEGTAKYSSGALLPAAVLNPIATAGALAGGALANTVVNAGSQLAGVEPDTARLMGDIASVPGAMLGESPRLGGYLSEGVKAILPAAWRAGLGHAFLPNPADVTAAATEGAKGKLWTGPMNRLLLRPPSAPQSPVGSPTLSRFDISQYGAPPFRVPPVEVGGGHIPDLVQPISVMPEPELPPETAQYPPTQSRFSVSQYGSSPSRIPPVEVGGGHIPEFDFSNPWQPPPPPAPSLQEPPVPYAPTQGRFSVSQYGAPPPKLPTVEVGGGHIPDLVNPLESTVVPTPLQPPEWIAAHPNLSNPKITPSGLEDMRQAAALDAFNEVFSDLTPAQQKAIDADLETKMRPQSLQNVESFTGNARQKRAIKAGGASFAQTPAPVVIPSQSLASLVVNPLESVVAPTPLTPPVTPAPAAASPSGILQNLIKTVQTSPDTNAETIAEHAGNIGHNLTTSKNSVIANHLLGQGLTPEAWDALPMDQKNAWVKKVNAAQKKSYKPFGADFGPGRYGRPAEEGARQVGDAMRVLGAKPPQ